MDYTSVSLQIELLCWFFLLGIIVGLSFDLYRILRGLMNPGKIATILGDIIFWILVTIIVFGGLIVKNWGSVRGYVFLGILIGFGVYKKIFSSIFVFWFLKGIRSAQYLLVKIFEFVITPFLFLGKKIVPGIKKVVNVVKRVISIPVKIIRDAKRIIPKISRK